MPDSAAVISDPFARFADWMKEAWAHEPDDANAMTLATVSSEGAPSARIVLLKGADERGSCSTPTRKAARGMELAASGKAALLFHWKPQGRQVRIEGHVEQVTAEEADAYYASRPRISRLGAWASDQSRELPERAELERRLAEYAGKAPRGDDTPPTALVGVSRGARAVRVLAEHAVPAA